MNLDSKLFDATLDLERVKVSVRTLVKLSRQEQSAIIRTLNEFGFLLLRSEQGEDRQELLALKELFGRAQCHQPKLQPCPRQAPRSSQPPWPSGDDQASAAQSGGLTGLAVM
ncbi:hypothetical protein L4Q67_007060 [Pseudomonas aeruginosa]|nr:hypothetical protein [Pseudomonas aeruginosa]MDV9555092.1 hypothetical protein [Pseudomonas aeruginosa]WGW60590.1 hypothetical protein P7I89_22525 [Pseudomonas aeruginosa]